MMNMNPALATVSTGIVQTPANGAILAIPGVEGFAEVMAGIASPPVATQAVIASDAKLRFNIAPAAPAPAATAPTALSLDAAEAGLPQHAGVAIQTDLAPADMVQHDVAPADVARTDMIPTDLATSMAAMRGDVSAEPAGTVAPQPPVERADGRMPVRSKRDREAASPETTPGTQPAPPPATPVIAPLLVVPAVAPPAPAATGTEFDTPRRAAREAPGRGVVAAAAPPAVKAGLVDAPAAAFTGLATREAGNMAATGAMLSPSVADRIASAQAQVPGSGPMRVDRGEGAEPVPASLTAVADIVQNLPPLIQSQVGAATAPAPSAAVRPAVDVGASLSGQVIDMGVGGQWIDRVAKEITALAEGNGHSRFQLNPPNLGRLQIDVWQGERGGRVQLLTETHEAAMRLQQDQASLQADARLSALAIDRIVIERAPGGLGASPDQGARHHPGADATDRGNNSPSGNPAGQQATAQQGHNGAATGQGKAAPRRDVFNDHTQPDVEDRGPSGRADDRHVRYA